MQPPTEVLRRGWQLYGADLFDEALELVSPALEETPNDGRLWELVGLIHRAKNDCRPCLHALEMATLFVPLSFAAQCALADCYVYTQRSDAGRVIYQHLLAHLHELPTDLLKNLAVGFESLSDLASALEVSREAARRQPDSPQHRYAIAYFMGQLGYGTEAVAAWAKQAVRLAPERAQYRIGLAGLVYQSGRILEAYGYVRDLTADEIRTVPCGKCLEKLEHIYSTIGDEARESICRAEMEDRRARGEDTDRQGC